MTSRFLPFHLFVTLWDKLNRLSPRLVRLLARSANGRHGLSHREIAALSGLSVGTVGRLSTMNDWETVSVSVARRFSAACGVDHLRVGRHMDYLKRRKMTHIGRGSLNQTRFYNRLFIGASQAKGD